MTDTRLLELLEQDINTSRQLLEVLEQEFAALNERKLEQLQQLLDKKQPLLMQLNQNAGTRSTIMRKQGVSADRQGFEQLAAQSAVGEQLRHNHSTLNDLIERCQSANMRNGRLIRANQTSVNSALNIIRGSGNEPSLYDKSGSTGHKSTQRTFTKA